MARMTVLRKVTGLLVAGVCGVASAAAQQTASSTLQVSVEPECAVSVASSTTTSRPGAYLGNISFAYRLRTSVRGGGGAIELSVGGRDFTGAALSFTTILNGRGEARSASSLRAFDHPIPIALFGANAHTSAKGDTGSAAWVLQNYTGAPPSVRLSMKCY